MAKDKWNSTLNLSFISAAFMWAVIKLTPGKQKIKEPKK